MKKFLQKLFHRHLWYKDMEEYVGDGTYYIFSKCSICGKTRGEYIHIGRY